MPDDANTPLEGVDSDRGVANAEGGVERPKSPVVKPKRGRHDRSDKQIAAFKLAQEARRAQIAKWKEVAEPPAPPPLAPPASETTTVREQPGRKGRSDKGTPRPHTRKEAIVQAAKQQSAAVASVQPHRAITLVYV